MQLVLSQSFPLGRFHATPWRVNPFTDPNGEWPPSPWRLVRAVVARGHQWLRESGGDQDASELDALVEALCDSSYQFHLPANARRGSPLRQYQPAEFGWSPPAKSQPGMRCYSTTLVQDNYWTVPHGSRGLVWWFIDGDRWTQPLLGLLDRCLERIVYFGRAETLTRIKRMARLTDEPTPVPNCELRERPYGGDSPGLLVPNRSATRAHVELTTDDPAVSGSTVPQGARMAYADLPRRPRAVEQSNVRTSSGDCRLIQFAMGWNVRPQARAIVRLTERFRARVTRELLLIKTRNQTGNWREASEVARTAVADMLGKNAEGEPLRGHGHAEFLAWWENDRPTRLLVSRQGRPFDVDEQTAIYRAAWKEISWAATGREADAWKIRLIPLDSAVGPPPGFDSGSSSVWHAMTPYVPPRYNSHAGKLRATESMPVQVRRELVQRGVPGAEAVNVEEFRVASWVAVHTPYRERLAGQKRQRGRRGYWLRLEFPEPVSGPLRLGHSNTFGLGLFRPHD